MDTLTHALSGALMARAVLPARLPHTTRADCMALGFLAAAFPDADVVLSYLSPLAYLHHHRGVTHSVGFQAWQRERAIDIGEQYARRHGIDAAAVSALPRPVSPYNWMVIVATADEYHYSFVNLRRAQPRPLGADDGFVARLDAPYLPAAMAQWQSATKLGTGADRALAEQVWRDPGFGFFRWFAAYPVLAEVQQGNPSRCVWFQDLRFLTPGRDQWPFRYGMCSSEDVQRWQAYQALEPGKSLALSR